MASGDHLKALLKSHIDGDDRHFYAIAMQLAAHEAKQGHVCLADELRKLIDAAKISRNAEVHGQPIPITKPRGELASLLQVSYPKNRLADMVLDATVADSLRQVIKEQRYFAKLRDHGLHPRRKVLLVGPPGTGKTLTAATLAGELGVPLFLVRLEVLITKYMGETAAKLRQIFDALTSVRGVYFFDEFDAIGSQRGLANDVGETRRILNSFLMMIEQDDSSSLIIAATNHPEILDYALFRRFDDVIEYHLPDTEQIRQVLRMRLGRFSPKQPRWASLVKSAQGLSHADIARAAHDAIKNAVMHDDEIIDQAALQQFLVNRQNMRDRGYQSTSAA
ncbi:MAG: ATP-binding protein [Candidimonas sp.]|nr:MAG: ATP-binding protein [Candidimonas sp.]TAM26672.1 MAG: ATP-binding protein [Candidimonas sp.]TAM75379.1 MAG: ATP-binding protein [Candidimonas sp.]